jgi:hypothetical protein
MKNRKYVGMIIEMGSEDSISTGKLYGYLDSAVHIGRVRSRCRVFDLFLLYESYKTEQSGFGGELQPFMSPEVSPVRPVVHET